ncbi:MAG: CRTAC1 family protein [Thermoanaerobaculia bacterium]|nr:CRTAC1 family protein [Thermoanaerobaculia bacterium]
MHRTAWLLLAFVPWASYAEQPVRFVDRAADWGVEFLYESGRDGRFLEPEIFGSGVALVDVDGDGDLDIFLAQGGRLTPAGVEAQRDELYRQDLFVTADGKVDRRFVEIGEISGLAKEPADGYGMGVAVGDVDGDGYPDLYVTNFGPDRLWRNRGDGTLEDATAEFGLQTAAAAAWNVPAVFFDYDADGRLDLWVGRYLDYRVGADVECTSRAGARDYCGPLVYPALSDLLWHNVGGGFEDVSASAGIAAQPGRALGGVAFDVDVQAGDEGDGRFDLYVANDLGENFLWRNRGDGTFVDEALLAGAAINWRGEAEGSMGVEAQDYDGDGDDDLFMTHTTLATNTLFENRGGWLFDDRSRESGLGPPSVGTTGFGTVFLDVDLDGDLDLFLANGAVRAIETLAKAGDEFPYREPDLLLLREGSTYREVDDVGLERSDVARAAALGDLDEDGDPDLVVGHLDAPVEILENRTLSGSSGGDQPSWLGVRVLSGDGSDLLGSRVGLRTGQGIVWRRVRTDGSYAAAHDPRVLFGLRGSEARSRAVAGNTVEIRPAANGRPLRWRGLPSDSYSVLRMPGGG